MGLKLKWGLCCHLRAESVFDFQRKKYILINKYKTKNYLKTKFHCQWQLFVGRILQVLGAKNVPQARSLKPLNLTLGFQCVIFYQVTNLVVKFLDLFWTFQRTIMALGHLVMSCGNLVFIDLIEHLLTELGRNDNMSTTRTYIQCTAAISRQAGHRIGQKWRATRSLHWFTGFLSFPIFTPRLYSSQASIWRKSFHWWWSSATWTTMSSESTAFRPSSLSSGGIVNLKPQKSIIYLS